MKYPIATICGSMTLYPHMLAVARELTHKGYIVLMPFVAMKDDDERASDLHAMHLAKIDLSTMVALVTEAGRIGETTANEMNYAKEQGKLIMRYDIPRFNMADGL